MILDRTNAPDIQLINEIEFHEPKFYQLSNGVKIFSFNDSEQPLIRLEFVFRAGAKYSINKRLPMVVNKLMVDGTLNHSSKKIATLVDYCGAVLKTESTIDHAILSLTVLHKHLETMLPIVNEIIHQAIFPEEELKIFLSKKEQEILIDNQKVSHVARDQFPSLLYGENHVYGRPVILSDYKKITRDALLDFYNKFMQNTEFEIFVSGSFPENFYESLEKYFGMEQKVLVEDINVEPIVLKRNFIHSIEFADAVQNAIRLGRPWPSRTHEDYVSLMVLVNLFGGYFGSRLMTNIREDKGYTYGIGAGVKHFYEASFMFIGTEVKAQNYKDVIKEIHHEMDILRSDIVPDDELMLVKSVMQGSFQRGFDGPFARADRFKELRMNSLPIDYYQKFIYKLKEITPMHLLKLAEKYFNFDEYYQLIVGKL